jgi:aldehyde dehydrogenase (NAD+)
MTIIRINLQAYLRRSKRGGPMRTIEHIYIDGQFVEPHGRELFDLFNPATGKVIGRVRLGDAEDARAAIAAAKRAQPAMARTSKAERLQMLEALHAALNAHVEELREAVLDEYGAPISRSSWMAEYAAEAFVTAARALADYPLERQVASARVRMEPVGVVGLITPWNSNAGFICNKLAYAIAAGCAAVIKPSEMSATQTEVVLRALHQAGLPAGVYNVVNGRGAEVGAELAAHPDVAKISFTGSTAVGKSIVRASADTLKRVTLELGGKSPTIVLDDADLEAVIPGVIEAGFMNSGQACVAGTRILVSEARRAALEAALKAGIEVRVKVGEPRDPSTTTSAWASRTAPAC